MIGKPLWSQLRRVLWMFFIDSTDKKFIGLGYMISPETNFVHGPGILSEIIGIYLALQALLYNDLVN